MKHKTHKFRIISLIIAVVVVALAIALGKESIVNSQWSIGNEILSTIDNGPLTSFLRPLAAAEKIVIEDLTVDLTEIEVAKKIVDLFERWDPAAKDRLIAMGFSKDDMAGLQRLYKAVWPDTTPNYKYLEGGHLFYGRSEGLFDALQTNWFAYDALASRTHWPQIGNTIEDAYTFGHFQEAVIRDIDGYVSYGYVAVFNYTFFNDRVAKGKAFIAITPQGYFFCVQDLPIDYAVKIMVTNRCMKKIQEIYKSERNDMLAQRIRRLWDEGKFVLTKGREKPSWIFGEDELGSELWKAGIGGAILGARHKTNIIWTLREPHNLPLRARLIEVLGRPRIQMGIPLSRPGAVSKMGVSLIEASI